MEIALGLRPRAPAGGSGGDPAVALDPALVGGGGISAESAAPAGGRGMRVDVGDRETDFERVRRAIKPLSASCIRRSSLARSRCSTDIARSCYPTRNVSDGSCISHKEKSPIVLRSHHRAGHIFRSLSQRQRSRTSEGLVPAAESPCNGQSQKFQKYCDEHGTLTIFGYQHRTYKSALF